MDKDFLKNHGPDNSWQENKISWIFFAILVIVWFLDVYFFYKATGVITTWPHW